MGWSARTRAKKKKKKKKTGLTYPQLVKKRTGRRSSKWRIPTRASARLAFVRAHRRRLRDLPYTNVRVHCPLVASFPRL